MRAAIEEHLGSRDVARVIYGTIIGLALVVALDQHPPTATQATAAIVVTAIAVGLAEMYSEFVATETRERRPVGRSEIRQQGPGRKSSVARSSAALGIGQVLGVR